MRCSGIDGLSGVRSDGHAGFRRCIWSISTNGSRICLRRPVGADDCEVTVTCEPKNSKRELITTLFRISSVGTVRRESRKAFVFSVQGRQLEAVSVALLFASCYSRHRRHRCCSQHGHVPPSPRYPSSSLIARQLEMVSPQHRPFPPPWPSQSAAV